MPDNLRREMEELANPGHPRQRLSAMGQLSLVDREVNQHGHDMREAVIMSDAHDRTPDEAVGSKHDDRRPDPTDANLADEEHGMEFLKAIEPVEADDKLLDLFG